MPIRDRIHQAIDDFEMGRSMVQQAIRTSGPLSEAERRRKKAMMNTIIFFIIGLSVILAYDWKGTQGETFNATTILFGILVASIIYIATRASLDGSSAFGYRLRFCPECGRQIPFDANLCPYCGHRFH
jgi:rRNA maturation endonuclease Nob1